MSTLDRFRRARAMTAAEMRFRTSSALRKHRDRVVHRVRPSAWDRQALAPRLSGAVPSLRDVPALIRSGQWDRAEEIVARHFCSRVSVWPVSARDREPISEAIASRFPAARTDAARRADRILEGRYDLLGYRDLNCLRVPDWHLDVVHGRRPPRIFWADVPYLDPACGDHKIIWELNRHQHWMSLGRSFWLDRNPACARAFVDQLYSWLDANPPLAGVNWASMLELAFRSISWTWALEFFADIDAPVSGGRPWRLDLLAGLDRQLGHVAQNLSRYFSPNTHLTGEALALYAVSLAFPELRDSGARAALGRAVLLQESTRQVLPDGGHIERSTHYHRYSTDFYLLATIVARRSGDSAAAAFAATAKAQADVLRTLADERGGLQTIGDDDGGQLFAMCGTPPADVRTTLAIAAEVLGEPSLAVSAPTEESCWVSGPRQAAAPRTISIASPPARWPSRALPESGYFVARAHGELAIFDAGAHGFLNGGHAHADALAIVTTAGSKPLLIDPGTGTYTMDRELRDRLRSGRMHNTVLVDAAEHTAVDGPFHWRTRTDAKFIFTHTADRGDIAQGVHDGYVNVRHVRTLFAVHGDGWLVVDQLLGHGRHRAEAFWHVDPAWKPNLIESGVALKHADGSESVLAAGTEGIVIMEDGPDAIHAPEYGRIEKAPVVRVCHEGDAPFTVATYIASSTAAPRDIAVAVHSCAAPDGWVAAAVVVTTPSGEIAALTAAPARQTDASHWPGIRYGVPGFQTNGRAAISVRRNDSAWHSVAGGNELMSRESGFAAAELACAVHGGSR